MVDVVVASVTVVAVAASPQEAVVASVTVVAVVASSQEAVAASVVVVVVASVPPVVASDHNQVLSVRLALN